MERKLSKQSKKSNKTGNFWPNRRENSVEALFEAIRDVGNPTDEEIRRTIVILFAAHNGGPTRVASQTGYDESLVDAIWRRMERAGLWGDEYIDDREWYSSKGKFNAIALFHHALVALGRCTRKPTLSGAQYFDNETGDMVYKWVAYPALESAL